MQALSLSVHIPLVCFGIAFPAMVLFAEWRYLRTGDRLYRTLARRWSKIMLALFAIGVVTGTILSFELGLLWPVWIGDFGSVFGLGFTLEGFSFFVEAIFIGIYVYGWDRLRPRLHFLSGLPIAVAGVTGSFFVISVNAWMNHPTGFRLVDGARGGRASVVGAVRQPVLLQRVRAHVLRRVHRVRLPDGRRVRVGDSCAGGGAGTSGRRSASRCRRRRSPRRSRCSSATGRPGTWRSTSRSSWPRSRGWLQTTRGATEHLLGWYNGHAVVVRDRDPAPAVAAGLPQPERRRQGPRHRPARRPAADQRRPLRLPDDGRDRHAARRCSASSTCTSRFRHRRLPRARWFYWAVVAAGPLSVVALIAGWVTTEVGRQPWVVYDVMRIDQAVTGATRHPRRLRRALASPTSPSPGAWSGSCAGSAGPLPLDLPAPTRLPARPQPA